jgi:hypothetical protein
LDLCTIQRGCPWPLLLTFVDSLPLIGQWFLLLQLSRAFIYTLVTTSRVLVYFLFYPSIQFKISGDDLEWHPCAKTLFMILLRQRVGKRRRFCLSRGVTKQFQERSGDKCLDSVYQSPFLYNCSIENDFDGGTSVILPNRDGKPHTSR